jgi:HEAT repeat protein/beta-lactamase regulating signal transducer with metallopeptidase domain
MIVVTSLLTYLLQSTLLLGGAWLASRMLRGHAVITETVWRVALLGSIAGPVLVNAGVVRPLSGTIAIDDLPKRHAVTESRNARQDTPVASVTDARWTAPPTATMSALTATTRQSNNDQLTRSHRVVDAAGSQWTPRWNWNTALAAAWGTTAGLFVAWHFIRRRRLFALLRRRELVTDAAACCMFEHLCAAAGLRRAVQLTTSPACPVPIALTSSEVCVPVRFFDVLDMEQQRGALAHEVAHVARRDAHWLTLDAMIGAVFFFQPLNLVARRVLREHAEWQCDEWAARQGAALGLARCLADVATWLRPFPRNLLAVSVPMAARQSDLLCRVERLLSDAAVRTPSGRSRPLAVASVIVIAATWAIPAFSAAVPSTLGVSAVAPAIVAVREPLVGSGTRTLTVPGQIVRAPRVTDPLRERWAWATSDARARSRRSYWVGYSFVYPLRPRQVHVSDSEGIDFNRVDWQGTPLGETLGVGVDNGIAVLVRYSGGASPSVNRVSHRSMNAPMDFDGATVYWLGGAEDAESVPWLDTLQQQMRTTALRSELVEGLAMHRTSAIVLPVLERLLGSDPDREIRAEAAEGLEYHPVPDALRLAHRTATRDSDQSVRAEAAEAIGGMPIEGAVEALVELANTSDDSAVRGEAAEALGSQPPNAALRGIEQVVFNSAHEDARLEAVEALGDLGGEAGLALLRRIIWEHPDTSTRVEAVETIGDLEGFDAMGELKELLERHTDREVRHEALEVLSDSESPQGFATLLEIAARAELAEMRRDAVEAVADAAEKGRSSAEIDQAATMLEHAIFNDRDESVQIEAVDALHELSRDRALAILRKVVETHASSRVRREARDAIAEISRQ